MSYRFCVYIKDDTILSLIQSQKNKSEYVERAIRFYEENKNIVARLADALMNESDIRQK